MWPQFEIQPLAVDNRVCVDRNRLRSAERAADHQNSGPVSALGKAAARSYGSDNGQVWRPGHGSRQPHFAHRINFVEISGREIHVIARFYRNILGQIPTLEESLEVQWESFALARQKA